MSNSLEHSGLRSLFAPAPAARYLTRDECEALCKKVLSFSKADAAQVTITGGARGNTRFAVNQISTSGDNFDHVVSVSATFGKRAGTSTTNKLDDASLKAVVDRAEALARLAPEDPEMMPDLGPQTYHESRDWSDATAAVDPAARAAAVKAITSSATKETRKGATLRFMVAGSMRAAFSQGFDSAMYHSAPNSHAAIAASRTAA